MLLSPANTFLGTAAIKKFWHTPRSAQIAGKCQRLFKRCQKGLKGLFPRDLL
jgi:hypothetical protein